MPPILAPEKARSVLERPLVESTGINGTDATFASTFGARAWAHRPLNLGPQGAERGSADPTGGYRHVHTRETELRTPNWVASQNKFRGLEGRAFKDPQKDLLLLLFLRNVQPQVDILVLKPNDLFEYHCAKSLEGKHHVVVQYMARWMKCPLAPPGLDPPGLDPPAWTPSLDHPPLPGPPIPVCM